MLDDLPGRNGAFLHRAEGLQRTMLREVEWAASEQCR